MTLEELLRTTITLPDSLCKDLELPIATEVSPDFVISIHDTKPYGVRIIVRAHGYGYDSETLGFMVRGNNLQQDDFGHPITTVADGTKVDSCPHCGAQRGAPHIGCILR